MCKSSILWSLVYDIAPWCFKIATILERPKQFSLVFFQFFKKLDGDFAPQNLCAKFIQIELGVWLLRITVTNTRTKILFLHLRDSILLPKSVLWVCNEDNEVKYFQSLRPTFSLTTYLNCTPSWYVTETIFQETISFTRNLLCLYL